jgi:hypothetical protein
MSDCFARFWLLVDALGRLVKRAIRAILILIVLFIAVLCVVCAIVNFGGRMGVVFGLLFGTLLGPLRIAGVDFRQWFRDPGTPSEVGDDSFIGLIKWEFHILGLAWLAAIVLLIKTPLWMPTVCRSVDVESYLAYVPPWLHLQSWLRDLFAACTGHLGRLNIVGGIVTGVAVVWVIVETVWRLGLVWRLLPPTPTSDYLAPQGPPHVRPKVNHPGRRRLIVCCDGTWNWPEPERETNVVRLVRALEPSDNGVAQIVHYHEGVGTGNFLDRALGGGVGIGLSASVKACYGFLVDNYVQYDEIFLFGFSRGAFVVRALAGMIGRVGILQKREMAQFAQVWNWYSQKAKRRDDDVLDELARHRHKDVDIECIGVWDTVGALGIPGFRTCASAFAFHETELGPHVRHAFQALAIDERRGNFQGAVWVPYVPDRARRGCAPGALQQSRPAASPHSGPLQVLEQCWFPGVHSNIGGGYLKHGLSDATFLWMVSKLTGLLGLDQRVVDGALDHTDKYPGGELAESRSLFWRLLWCPVPRPVCVISPTEGVYENAWNMATVPENDIYRGRGREKWLEAVVSRRVTAIAAPSLPAPFDGPTIPPRRGFCGWILYYLNPQG